MELKTVSIFSDFSEITCSIFPVKETNSTKNPCILLDKSPFPPIDLPRCVPLLLGAQPDSINLNNEEGKSCLYNLIYKPRSIVSVTCNSEMSGLLINKTENTISILSGEDEILIKNYSLIKETDSENSPFLQVYQNDCLKLNYITSNLFWSPSATINVVDDKLFFNLTANIKNKTAIPLGGKFNLVIGKPNKSLNYQRERSSSAKMLAPTMASPNVSYQDETNSDYKVYNIENLVLRTDTSSPLESFDCHFIKYYRYIVGNEGTEYGYMFKSPIMLPSTICRVYDNYFLGECPIKETRKDEKVELILGYSSIIRCNTSVQEKNIYDGEIVTGKEVSISSTIHNFSEEDLNLSFQYYVGYNRYISSIEEDEFKHGYLIWRSQINPGIDTLNVNLIINY